MICACGHGPHAHVAPAGPCSLCEWALAHHRYQPMEGDFLAELEEKLTARLAEMES